MKSDKNTNRFRRHKKIRTKMFGTALVPRLSVYRSNRAIYAQLIDDGTGKTLLSASSASIKKGKPFDRAREVGEILAQMAADRKIEKVVFDRGGFLYAGGVRALAEGARKGGLKF